MTTGNNSGWFGRRRASDVAGEAGKAGGGRRKGRVEGAGWEGSFEQLEGRILLSTAINLPSAGQGYRTNLMEWHGAVLEVISNSWIVTATQRMSEHSLYRMVQDIGTELQVSIAKVEMTGGRFARFFTNDRITEQQVQHALNRVGGALQVEPDLVKKRHLLPNDPELGIQWAIQNSGQFIPGSGLGLAGADMGMSRAWDVTTGSRSIVIPVLDTGIDLLHPDLVDNLWRNPGEIPGDGIDNDGNGYIDDVFGYDFGGNNDANPQDPLTQGHGTAVAGTVGAVGNNGVGVAGINWQVSMVAVKVFPDNGNASSFDIIEGIVYTTRLKESGVNIVASNNSYGSVRPDQTGGFFNAEEIAIQEFTDTGALFVASAGNDANDNDGANRAYPASYVNPRLISVAATDNNDQLADFTNFGATTVHIAAPGVRIRTTSTGGGYEYIDGTSFSGPYVAGALGLLAAANPFATPEALRDALFEGSDRLPQLEGRLIHGRMNVANSMRLVGFPGPLVTDIFPGQLSGSVAEISVSFNKPLDPSYFNLSGIELRRANGDGTFNGNDFFYNISMDDVTFGGTSLVIRNPLGGNFPLDQYRLTLRSENFRDFSGNFLNGTQTSGNNEVYEFTLVSGGGPLEPNDTFATATPIILKDGVAKFEDLVIGDGANPNNDVDMFRLTMAGSGLITVSVDARSLATPSSLDSVVRLFDSSGRELARNDNYNGLDSRLQYFLPNAGRYYIGVSGFNNLGYTGAAGGSGEIGGTTGTYNLTIEATTSTPDVVSYGSGTPVNIPATGQITSQIFVPDVRRIQDVNVRVDINHQYVQDLEIRLISPAGTTVTLVRNRGGSGDNFTGTIFDDEASVSIAAAAAPFTGRFRPEGELRALSQQSAGGVWTLVVIDSAPLNAGQLLGWSLDLTLENSAGGPFEFNDTIATATDQGLFGPVTRTFDATIGDGAFGLRDVDLYKVTAQAGSTINVSSVILQQGLVGFNAADSVLRLFDSQGRELVLAQRPDSTSASFSYPVQFSGVYYIGVSGAGNADYNPNVGGSGSGAVASGPYRLQISIVGGMSDGANVLVGNQIRVGVNTDGSIGLPGGGTGLRYADTELLVSASDLLQTDSFYGGIYDGNIFRNVGGTEGSDLPMTLTNQSDAMNRRIVAEGLFRSRVAPADGGSGGLAVNRTMSFGVNDDFIAIDVMLRNTTLGEMRDVAWVEGMRGAQGVNLGSVFPRTIHDVDATGRLVTSVYANSDFPLGLTLGMGAADPGNGVSVIASVEAPGTIRDPFQVIDSPVDPNSADVNGTMGLAFNVGSLAAGEEVSFRYFIFVGRSKAEVETRFAAVESGVREGHLTSDPLDPATAAMDLPYASYYPEGYANSRASTFVPISNPTANDARVVIIARYETGERDAVLFDGLVRARSRDGITITTPEMYANDTLLVRKDTPYAIEVRSSVPVSATMSHYDFGISTGQAFTSEASQVWTWGEGFKGPGLNDYLVFVNTSDTPIKATLTLYQETTRSTLTLTQEVGAHRRGGWDLASLPNLPGGAYGVKLETDRPVVAALTRFDTNQGVGFGILGLPSIGSTAGVVPGGNTGFNATREFVTILNTNNRATEVTFTFYFENQSAFRQQFTVPAGRRAGFDVAQLPGFPVNASQRYSIAYESALPVSVTLASFTQDGPVASRFTDTAATVWTFAEGFRPGAGSAVTEYLRLFNPTLDDMIVEITLDFAPNPGANDPGGTETFLRTIKARAANAFDIHSFVTGDRANRDTYFSVRVKAPQPIIALQGHYDSFLNGGFATLGQPLGVVGPAIVL